MDIDECNRRFGIKLDKLRRMDRAGVLKLDPPKTPEYWRRAVSEIRKGKMTARSIALVFRYRERLEKFAHLTTSDRRVISQHFTAVEFPPGELELPSMTTAVYGAAEKHAVLTERLIEALHKIIPQHHVGYEYVAVRLMLTCQADHEINLMAERMSQALSKAKEDPTMQGWWHMESAPYGKRRTIYHRPESLFDL